MFLCSRFLVFCFDNFGGCLGVGENGNCEQHKEEPVEETDEQDASSISVRSRKDNNISRPDDKVFWYHAN